MLTERKREHAERMLRHLGSAMRNERLDDAIAAWERAVEVSFTPAPIDVADRIRNELLGVRARRRQLARQSCP